MVAPIPRWLMVDLTGLVLSAILIGIAFCIDVTTRWLAATYT